MGVVAATRWGKVEGCEEAHSGGPVRVFRGVPYARPPTGPLRFAAPQPPVPWPDVRDATRFGAAAPQPAGSPEGGLVPGMGAGPTSEDCLTLNVWAPADATRSDLRAVLVWFYGGSFVIGASSQPAYDGARYAAEEGVVLVSANYRLGPLGFLDPRGLAGAGADAVANCGLRDAIAALEWVRDNIEQFGGDPERVAIFGESAGGGIVSHLCASPAASGLFRAAVVESGATDRTLDAQRSALVAESLMEAVGAATIDELRVLPADDVVAAVGRVQFEMLKPVGMMPFHPCVDGDVLTAPPREAFANGAFADGALIVGTTTDEMRLFLDPTTPAPDRDRLRTRIARYTGVDEHHADAVIDTYTRELRTGDLAEVWAAVFSDVEMQLPARAVLDAHAEHGHTWSYLFSWPAANARLRACHGVDIPFIFGTFDVDGWGEWVGADEDAVALSRRMRAAWAALARDGDPGWPEYRVPERAVRVLGRTDETVADPLGPRLSRLSPQEGAS
jgi:para-nitrobenzyl esterase